MTIPGISVHLYHLAGHQNRNQKFEYDTAPQEVQRNIDMVEATKNFLKAKPPKIKNMYPHLLAPLYPGQRVTLLIQDFAIVSNIDHHVFLHRHSPAMERRLSSKNILAKSTMSHIQWRGIELAMKNTPATSRLPIVNILHEKWDTQATIASRHNEMNSTFVRCQQYPETRTHVFQCRSKQASDTFITSIAELPRDLTKCKTASIITTHFIAILTEQRRGYVSPIQPHPFQTNQIKSLTKQVYQYQRLADIRSLSKGFFIIEWEALQNMCANHGTILNTNLQWVTQAILALWKYSLTQWNDRCVCT